MINSEELPLPHPGRRPLHFPGIRGRRHSQEQNPETARCQQNDEREPSQNLHEADPGGTRVFTLRQRRFSQGHQARKRIVDALGKHQNFGFWRVEIREHVGRHSQGDSPLHCSRSHFGSPLFVSTK